MHKSRVGVALVCFGMVLIIATAALITYNMLDDRRAQNEVESVMEQMVQIMPSPHQGIVKDDEGSDPLPESTVQPTLEPLPPMPTVIIDNRPYIGTLAIPSLWLELPIIDYYTERFMKIAPCRYYGSPYYDNFVIVAHNYASHFGRIKNLEKGDLIVFTDIDGNQFRYRIDSIETLTKFSVEEMVYSDYPLTLFTCTVGGHMRVAARCVRDTES